MNERERKQIIQLLGTIHKKICRKCKREISQNVMDYFKINLMYGRELEEWDKNE